MLEDNQLPAPEAPEDPQPKAGGEVAPLTAEDFRKELANLVERGHAAGLRPIQIMFSVYAEKGISTHADRAKSILNNLFEALDAPQKGKF